MTHRRHNHCVEWDSRRRAEASAVNEPVMHASPSSRFRPAFILAIARILRSLLFGVWTGLLCALYFTVLVGIGLTIWAMELIGLCQTKLTDRRR